MTQPIPQTQPFELPFDLRATAPVMVDMQRDFVEAEGFSEVLSNGVSLVRTVIAPCTEVLAAAHQRGIMVIHTREDYRVGPSDCPSAKLAHGGKTFTGEPGPIGRTLVRGEVDHDITPELHPAIGEPVIDEPGKGVFYQADLHLISQDHGTKTLIARGVTVKACVTTTVCEVNDCGYERIIPESCVGSYFPESQKYAPEIIGAQGAIFGWVTNSKAIIASLED